MNISKYALGVLAAAGILAGCSGAQSGLGQSGTNPSVGGVNMLQTEAVVHPQALHQLGLRQATAVHPNKKGGGQTAYITGIYTDEIYVFPYTKGKFGSQSGTITSGVSEPQGVCGDKSDVWVANTGDSNVLEFAAGGTTQIGSLTDSGMYPTDCAIGKGGDIAVSNIESTSGTEGSVVFYKGGTGSGKSVTCSNLYRYYFDTYDKKGNLWVDGEDSSGAFGFCEIKAGASSGTAITLNTPPGFPGGVQMDGKDVTILDQDASTIDKYVVSGTSGTEKGTIVLDESGDDLVTDWFDGKYILAGNFSTSQGDSFKKKGGAAISTVDAEDGLGIGVGGK